MTQNRNFYFSNLINEESLERLSNLPQISQLWWEKNLCPDTLPPSILILMKAGYLLMYDASLGTR